MKTTMKKVLSMTLALVLLLGVLPMTTLAAEKPDCFVIANGTHTHKAECTKAEHVAYDDANAVTCVDANGSGYCDVCWGAMPVAHTCTGGTAYCNARAYCDVCGEQYGTVDTNNHRGPSETTLSCNENEHYHYCVGCNAQINKAPHDWEITSCTTRRCKVCPKTETGEYHDWANATCTAPKTCSVCNATEGSALDHTWVNGNCTTPKTCSVCGATEAAAPGHTWRAADCVTPKTCSVCGVTEGNALGHDFSGNATKCHRCQTAATAIPKFTVYYNLNVDEDSKVNHKLDSYYVGTSMSTILRDLGLVNVQFTGLFRDWFYLEGWYLNGVKVTGNETLTGDCVLVAKWVQKYNYEVILKLYTNGNTNTVVKVLDVFPQVQDDGKISHSEVTAIAKQYIESNNDAPITVYGPFDANGWERYSLYPNRLTSTEYVEVNPYGTTVVHAMVHNAKIYNGTSSTSKADSTNPKTGDMIMMPAAVLGLSASALAVMFYLKKKRAY